MTSHKTRWDLDADEFDADDDLMRPTPRLVVRALGFDPIEESGENVEVKAKAAVVVLQDSPNARHAARAVLRAAQLQSVANWMQAQAEKRTAQLEKELASEVEESGVDTGIEKQRKSALKK